MSLGCHYAELGTLIAKFTPAHFSNKVKTSDELKHARRHQVLGHRPCPAVPRPRAVE